MTKAEREALKYLQSDKNLIIKQADKGGAIVLQNVSGYKTAIERQLRDEKYYRKLKSDPTYQSEVNTFLEKAVNRGVISNKLLFFVKSPSIPVLYILPKIHKSLEHPPGRPVMAGINSVTASLSTFVDYHIKPLVFELPTFLKDSDEVIQ